MTDKPIQWATAITGGIDIHCCKCGARMTAAAYIIETCQECGAAKQDKRRRLACMRHCQKQGKRLAKEMQRRADEAYLAAYGDKDDGSNS